VGPSQPGVGDIESLLVDQLDGQVVAGVDAHTQVSHAMHTAVEPGFKPLFSLHLLYRVAGHL